jgi:hypothetical protein
MLFYELKKIVSNKAILLLLGLLITANIFSITYNYLFGSIDDDFYLPKLRSSPAQLTFYKDAHLKLDGPITELNQNWLFHVTEVYENGIRLGQYTTLYDPDTYTGYYFGDYVILKKHLYTPYYYTVSYKAYAREVVQRADENITFYSNYKNYQEVSKNKAISWLFKNREINAFYDLHAWELLFKNWPSDVIILLFLIFCTIQVSYYEKSLHLTALIKTTQNGKKALFHYKWLTLFLMTIFVVALFSFINCITYQLLYGLNGGYLPLYSIESYKNTPFTGRIDVFYLILIAMKCLGSLVIVYVIAWVSSLFASPRNTYVVSLMLVVVAFIAQTYIYSEIPVQIVVSLLSPMTLLRGERLFTSFYGLNIDGLNHFVFRSHGVVAIQLLLIGCCVGLQHLHFKFQER